MFKNTAEHESSQIFIFNVKHQDNIFYSLKKVNFTSNSRINENNIFLEINEIHLKNITSLNHSLIVNSNLIIPTNSDSFTISNSVISMSKISFD